MADQSSTGSMNTGPTTPAPILAIVTQYREKIAAVASDVKNIKSHAYFGEITPPDSKADKGEMIANIMIAYRHLEDARMRLGKVFEAYFGEGIGSGPIQK